MSKRFFAIILTLFLFLFPLTACKEEKETVTVTYMYGVLYTPTGFEDNFDRTEEIPKGSYISYIPKSPYKNPVTFAGWYLDGAHTTYFNHATTPVNSDITLYAKWRA